MNTYKKCLMLLLCAHTLSAQADSLPNEPPTDSYDWVVHYGMGDLDLWRISSGLEGALFQLNTVSERGSVCDVSGTIHNGQAQLKTDEGGCVVDFSQTADQIRVSRAPSAACDSFCGYGVDFVGEYRLMPSECSPEEREHTDWVVNDQLRKKRYAQAIGTLRRMWQTCAPTLHWLDELKLRNNLAATYAKIGDHDQCIKLLQPYRKEILAKNPMDMREQPVSYLFEADYRAQINDARSTWKCCQ